MEHFVRIIFKKEIVFKFELGRANISVDLTRFQSDNKCRDVIQRGIGKCSDSLTNRGADAILGWLKYSFKKKKRKYCFWVVSVLILQPFSFLFAAKTR